MLPIHVPWTFMQIEDQRVEGLEMKFSWKTFWASTPLMKRFSEMKNYLNIQTPRRRKLDEIFLFSFKQGLNLRKHL